jgi:hypothetical protein
MNKTIISLKDTDMNITIAKFAPKIINSDNVEKEIKDKNVLFELIKTAKGLKLLASTSNKLGVALLCDVVKDKDIANKIISISGALEILATTKDHEGYTALHIMIKNNAGIAEEILKLENYPDIGEILRDTCSPEGNVFQFAYNELKRLRMDMNEGLIFFNLKKN